MFPATFILACKTSIAKICSKFPMLGNSLNFKQFAQTSNPRIVTLGNHPGSPCGGTRTHVSDIAEYRKCKGKVFKILMVGHNMVQYYHLIRGFQSFR